MLAACPGRPRETEADDPRSPMPAADLGAPPCPPPSGAGRRRIRVRHLLYGAVALALLAVLAEAARILFGGNFHAVIPGRVYRCSQPSPRSLKEMVASHGVRTVVNLRGCCNPF